MQLTLTQFQGSLLTLAQGDASGAPHEGGWLERGLWRCIGRTADGLPRWTDDPLTALDVADGLRLWRSLHAGGCNLFAKVYTLPLSMKFRCIT